MWLIPVNVTHALTEGFDTFPFVKLDFTFLVSMSSFVQFTFMVAYACKLNFIQDQIWVFFLLNVKQDVFKHIVLVAVCCS